MNSGSRRYFCIGLGEVLWDLLPGGRQLGGAPANFAYHAHALGAESLVVSRVGRDDLGRDLLERLNALGLATSGISVDPVAPTGTVSVTLDPTGQPAYTIHTDVAWDFLEAGPEVLRVAAGADAVCFGTLAQRHPVARESIRRVLQATRPEALRIFDINLRQRFWSRDVIVESLALANVLKLNDEELPILAELLGGSGDDDPLGPCVEVSQSTLQLSDGGEGDARGVGHHGLGETGPLTEFPELHSKAVLKRFIYQRMLG